MTSINNDIDQQLGHPQSGPLLPAPLAPTQEELTINTDFLDRFITKAPVSRASLVKTAAQFAITSAPAGRFLKRLSGIGAITSSGGLYLLSGSWLYQLSKPLSVMRIEKAPRQPGKDQLHWRSVGPSPRSAAPAATSEVAVAVAPTGGSPSEL
ncbi:MAG TPA: hypothetical protein VJA21_21400 [Verrucomicrobiae bacterium]